MNSIDIKSALEVLYPHLLEEWKKEAAIRSLVNFAMSPFRQDTEGVEAEGVYYPPTFNWLSVMTCISVINKTYYARVVIRNEDAETAATSPLKFSKLADDMINQGVLTIEKAIFQDRAN